MVVTVFERVLPPPVKDELVDPDFLVSSNEVVKGVIRIEGRIDHARDGQQRAGDLARITPQLRAVLVEQPVTSRSLLKGLLRCKAIFGEEVQESAYSAAILSVFGPSAATVSGGRGF